MTTSNKVEFNLILKKTSPLVGPPLDFSFWINDCEPINESIVNTKTFTFNNQLRLGMNTFYIESKNRTADHTIINSHGQIETNAGLKIVKFLIDGVRFKGSGNGSQLTTFKPNYSEHELNWLRKTQPGVNFPDELPGTDLIEQNGVLEINFLYPLSEHGIRFGSYLYFPREI